MHLLRGGIVNLKFIAAGVLALVAVGASAQNLNGAGATFPYPIYSKWFSEYKQQNPSVQINYQSIGSGGGIQQVTSGTVDFGAADVPMTDEQLAKAKVKVKALPTVLGAVVPVYNLPGVNKDLNFSGDVIADIYLGTITNWSDARIAKDNPGVSLPNHSIIPVYRSEGSGTSFIFTDFLSKVNADFKSKVGAGAAVRWPVGIGQKGNEGVAGMVRQAPFSFGYVELIYAEQNKMSFGAVKNAAGKYLKASTAGVTAAAASAAKTMPADYRVSITNAAGPDSYPISSFTWLLIPTQSTDAAKTKALVGFLNWMLDHGEAEAASLSYAPLPKQVQDMVRKSITTIK
jgi:phosphate transport system substrate-binding protein